MEILKWTSNFHHSGHANLLRILYRVAGRNRQYETPASNWAQWRQTFLERALAASRDDILGARPKNARTIGTAISRDLVQHNIFGESGSEREWERWDREFRGFDDTPESASQPPHFGDGTTPWTGHSTELPSRERSATISASGSVVGTSEGSSKVGVPNATTRARSYTASAGPTSPDSISASPNAPNSSQPIVQDPQGMDRFRATAVKMPYYLGGLA
jgi:hypothetical protein